SRCFGRDEMTLRLFPAFFGVLTIYLVYVFAKTAFDKRTALTAAFLTAFSPLHVYYSQELRTYSLVTFLSLLAVFFLLKSLETGDLKFWSGYVFFNVLSLYLHYMMALVLLAQVLFVIIFLKHYRRNIAKWIIANILILVFILPWLINSALLIKEVFVSKGHLWIPGWANRIGIKSLFFTLKNLIAGYHEVKFMYWPVVIVSLGLVLLGAFRARGRGRQFVLCLSCFLVPPLSMFLISKSVVWYVDRYVIVSSVFLLTLIAYGLSSLKRVYLAIGLSFYFFCFVSGCYNYYRAEPADYQTSVGLADRHDFREVCNYLSGHLERGDIILYTPSYSSTASFAYYLRKRGVDGSFLKGLPVILSTPEEGSLVPVAKEFDFKGCKYREIPYGQLIAGKKRIWLVVSDWFFDSGNYLENEQFNTVPWMETHYKEIVKKDFKGIVLYLFSA
ncbi:MAG: glycosyltransferase family 39 protein, partial [Candidatus Omnitrophica bacterium]|nr:glycosyltransferase family 39 protein [Candidatus Omnitrophota bacterium]